MFSKLKKAGDLASIIVIIAGVIPAVITLIKAINAVITEREVGAEKKKIIMETLETSLVEIDKLFAMELPIETILAIFDKLIDIYVAILKSTGTIEH